MKPGSCLALLMACSLVVVAACEYDATSSVTDDLEVSVDASVLDEYRARWLLAEEPDDVVGILELRERLQPATDDSDPEKAVEAVTDIAVVGQIPAAAQSDESGWDPGKALFVMVDPAAGESGHDDAHAHEGDHQDCPYCNKDPLAARAMVQFLADDGRPLPIDARVLFELHGGELVVVQGDARINAGTLVVTGAHLYVRR